MVAPAVARAPGRPAQVFAATAATTTTGVTGPAGGGDGAGGDGGSGGGLPITGTPVAALAVGGGLLVAVGAALALTGGRRRLH